MFKIAIIQFPGLNTEYETRREINRAGMRGDFFRWNDKASKLASYDGYVIGGGFSYEDRGRAGIIASLDPIMKEIKQQSGKGKPVLGICNGAQILVEAGLIPGVDGGKLAMGLARNRRVRDGEVLGTGYYNAWVHLKCSGAREKCMFTWNMKEGEILAAPVAHGEGRFTTEIEGLLPQLQEKGMMVLRYCNRDGVVNSDFPVNPNGSAYNIAALCNPAGNVMAVMPHLERSSEASYKLFTSLRDALGARKAGGLHKRIPHVSCKTPALWPLALYTPAKPSAQFFISLIINDNEAETFELALERMEMSVAWLKRVTHIELRYHGAEGLQKISKKLVQSGVLLNTNKESVTALFAKGEKQVFDAKKEKFVQAPQSGVHEGTVMKLLVREREDFVGLSKLATIQKRLKMPEITSVRMGTLWQISFPTKSKNVAQDTLKKLLATHLFFNPHRQEAFLI